MSAQAIADAFAPVEAAYRVAVMKDTWGHLAPKKNKTYRGRIVFAVGIYGSDELNPTVIHCHFDGLDDSPWFFDTLSDFLQEGQSDLGGSERRFPEGAVYQFDGTFRNYAFKGKFKRVYTARSN
jgi:hypothetical protein